jgi:hypothetical protein
VSQKQTPGAIFSLWVPGFGFGSRFIFIRRPNMAKSDNLFKNNINSSAKNKVIDCNSNNLRINIRSNFSPDKCLYDILFSIVSVKLKEKEIDMGFRNSA